jgi:D-sedoheptulose 7-phosphate isomerase
VSEIFHAETERARRALVRMLDELLGSERERLEQLAGWCAETLRDGGKLLLFGNGGSAAQAQHLAAEFVNRYEDRREGLAAIALATDGAVLTSIANDSDFERLFERQIEALGAERDLALAFSTSGESRNVVRGLAAARRRGLRTAALLGRDGGPAAREAELAIVVPGRETARIQEVHLFVGHLLCRRVETLVAAGGDPG